MTVTINFNSQEEAWITAQARQRGVPPAEIIRKLVGSSMPVVNTPASTPERQVEEINTRNRAAIALLQSWIAEDATDNPEKIRLAEQELEELKRNLNANRAAAGESPVFP